MKKFAVLGILAISFAAAAQNAPLWLRDAKISPDGSTIVFTYKGDIFTVPTNGGDAKRITSQTSYEQMPIWSPDGKTIAFASDRHGNFDIYSTPADGKGEWTRLTFNSASETPEAYTPDGKAVLYSAAIQDPASSIMFPVSRMTELYSTPSVGGAPTQIIGTPVHAVSWAADGKSFLYQDVKGFENTWRKHHTSSVTRNILRYDLVSGKHTSLIDNAGEDLNPIDAGEYIYFLSERAPQKSLNVYRASAANPTDAKAITNFKKHPVRFLSRANNGTLAFTYDGEIYTLAAENDAKPKKVKININADFPDETRKLSASRGAGNAVPSPDGKQIAMVYRGDVYVTSVDYSTTKQISNTAEAEGAVSWGNDSTLYYSSQRDGKINIYKATFNKSADEPDFTHATIINEEKVFKTDSHERNVPELSPDGKKLGFILDRNKLCVMDVESGKVTQLTDGSTNPSRTGGFNYYWSPDSRWIALEVVDRKHEPYSDIAIINVADGSMTNITGSGYFDAEPRWIMDGNALLFRSERYGMRNHASWGSQDDVMFVFMNQEAYDRFRMSKEDREIYDKKKEEAKKAEEKAKKDSEKDKKDDKKKDDKKNDKEVEPIVVELAGISDRQVRVTPFSTYLIDAIVDHEAKTLYFSSAADEGAFIWKLDLDKGDLSMERRHSDASSHFAASRDGKTLFLLGNTFNKFGSSLKPISYNIEKVLDPVAERSFIFDFVEREEAERFYVADMHGVNWKTMCADYRKFLPHINNNHDFTELLSELLGELNVSHTGSTYRPAATAAAIDRSAALGALYDLSYTGKGARIAEIIAKSPLAAVSPAVNVGDVIIKINGEDVTTEMPVDRLLMNLAGKRTRVTIQSADNSTRDVVLKPISTGYESSLLYDRWVKQRAADVDRLSNGRLGYVHIESMDDASFRRIYSDMLGKYNDREGLVIDIRWNGGGRLHEDIEVLLSGEKYFTQEIRGVETCDMPSRRWNKPTIMIMAEPCYSNAHGTPWVYKNRGLGKLVGMPVPGTMTSVNWVRTQDQTITFGIPVIGYRLADGSFLENQELEPDVLVNNAPEEIVAGIDAQLRTAVETLLRDIDSKK